MANNPYTPGLRFMRLRDIRGYKHHALSARAFAAPDTCAVFQVASIIGLAQGRIVSISRGSSPPKKR